MTARLEQILTNLDRDGVSEVMLESGRPVQVREEGVYVPVSQKPVPRDELEAMLRGTDIELPTSEGPQPAVELGVGSRHVRVRVSRRGNQLVVRIERSKNPPPPRTKTPTRTPTTRTSTRDRAPSAPRTATRNRRATSAPRTKAPTSAPRTKAATAAPRSKRQTNAPRDFELRRPAPTLDPVPVHPDLGSLDIELGEPVTAPPPRRAHSPSRIKLGGKELELELEDAAFKLDAPTGRPSQAIPALPSREPSQPLAKVSSQRISVPAVIPPQAPPIALRETADVPQPTFELADLSLDDLVPPNAEPTPPAKPAPIKPAPIELAKPAEPARPRPPTRASFGASKLDELVAAARARHATDLLVASGRPVLARLAGELVPLEPGAAPLAGVDEILLALLDADQKARLDQVGYIDLALEIGIGRLRANIGRVLGGLKGSFRLAAAAPQSLHELGLPKELAKVVSHHQGLVIVAGPSGHGKTTTLASLVDVVNASKPHHIITVEDPIEIVYPRKAAVVSQREAGRHTKSFATALKASLREDPDVIVIGELRDRETVEIALTAAETGHLVLATMSTPSAAKTIDRLIDMFPAEEQHQVRVSVASALRAIVAQRLMPAIGGGVVPAVEVVTGVLPLAVLIRDDKLFQLPSLMQRGKAFGMIRLEDSLAELQRAGKIR